MALIYEECGNCRRKGAYVVADRRVVRCKYCTASKEIGQLHPSDLGAVAAGLQAAGGRARGGGRRSSGGAELRSGREARIAGGVMSMDKATISILAGGAGRRNSSYPRLESAPPVSAPAERRDGTAVVIDDDPMLRSLVAAVLDRGGISVTETSSGEEGCASVLANPPDIALLDLSMPGMDGLEVLVELRRRCDIGIIVLSGRSNEGDRVVALQLGADDYIAKPFAPADLMSRVAAVVAARTRRPPAVTSAG